MHNAGQLPGKEVDVLSVETWDQIGSNHNAGRSRWVSMVRYDAPYAQPDSQSITQHWQGQATTYPNNISYIGIDTKPYYNPGWAFWAMPFGCMDTMDSGDLAGDAMRQTRDASYGCEGFYVDGGGHAVNREYMVPAYNMSDYYQIFPVWGDGANVAGYRRDKVSPVSFLPSARLGHYRNWTYEPPDFLFKAGPTVERLVIVFHWDFSLRLKRDTVRLSSW